MMGALAILLVIATLIYRMTRRPTPTTHVMPDLHWQPGDPKPPSAAPRFPGP